MIVITIKLLLLCHSHKRNRKKHWSKHMGTYQSYIVSFLLSSCSYESCKPFFCHYPQKKPKRWQKKNRSLHGTLRSTSGAPPQLTYCQCNKGKMRENTALCKWSKTLQKIKEGHVARGNTLDWDLSKTFSFSYTFWFDSISSQHKILWSPYIYCSTCILGLGFCLFVFLEKRIRDAH